MTERRVTFSRRRDGTFMRSRPPERTVDVPRLASAGALLAVVAMLLTAPAPTSCEVDGIRPEYSAPDPTITPSPAPAATPRRTPRATMPGTDTE